MVCVIATGLETTIYVGLHYVVILTLTLFGLVCVNDREFQFLQYYTLLAKKFGILEIEAECLFYGK
jgi:hypothetical protein